jgi:deoxycytidine triphosphate deaminase
MTKDEAIKRFESFRGIDPFPEIQPALLNSADVESYIKTIGMVYPYDESKLSGVTLGLCVGDVAVYWDKKNKRVIKNVKEEGEFKLRSNSIAFLQIAEELRLPAYIIVRFNLRVTNTYRGLLLGTGPIVDPGFEGQINIPIHNLTNNDYVFAHGEQLIEMEFTKISPNEIWKNTVTDNPPERNGTYKAWKPKFDKVKPPDRDILHYLRKANQGGSIQSSLPPLVESTQQAVDKVEKITDKVDTSLSRINVGLLFSFAALLTAIIAVVSIFRADIKEFRELKVDQRIRELEAQASQLHTRIDSLVSAQRDSLGQD